MVETRAQQQGAPLKKPGAYNTDAYYQSKDEGFGDLGVGQEPDTGAKDNPEDPEYTATAEELRQADTAREAEDREAMTAEEEKAAEEEQGELADRPDTRADLQNPNEEPVPLVETDADGREGQDAQEAADVPEMTNVVGP